MCDCQYTSTMYKVSVAQRLLALALSSSPAQLKPDFSLLVTFGAKKDGSSVVTDTLVKLGTTITN